MDTKTVILFDGVCNLCNGAVQFVLKRDKEECFSFASLQSDFGQDYLAKSGMDSSPMTSILLIEKGQIYNKSTAALRIAKHLSGGWKFLGIFLLVPRFLRDTIYDFIARNRYKWFGKSAQCMVPNDSVKKRFLE